MTQVREALLTFCCCWCGFQKGEKGFFSLCNSYPFQKKKSERAFEEGSCIIHKQTNNNNDNNNNNGDRNDNYNNNNRQENT